MQKSRFVFTHKCLSCDAVSHLLSATGKKKHREDQQVGVTAGYLGLGSTTESCLLLHSVPVAAQIEAEVRI